MHKETLLSMNINSLMLQDTRTHDDNCYRDDGTSTLRVTIWALHILQLN